MNKILAIVLVVVLIATLIPGVALADKPDTKGNGLPRDAGKSFNFNVIGVPEESHYGWDDDSGGNGKRIFITRNGITKFYVWGDPSGSFAIQDRNGLDGEVGWGRGSVDPDLAGIILPYDGTNNKWDCRVYVRLLGPIDSSFKWRSEYWDGTGWALIDEFTLYRDTKFNMPTGQILADTYQDILWTWDTKNNFRICQFRIFVGAPAGGYPPPAS